MESIFALILAKANYVVYIILMMVGLYAMIVKNNLIKKIVGMSIFQTAIILFYVSIGCKRGASIPILEHHASPETATHGAEKVVAHAMDAVNASHYINPLPHVLMLTAIVVGVATLGVALALAIKVYNTYGTVEEDEINQQLRSG
ncbi:cation:proton antiporter subunit C [Desulfocicer niacini]